MDTNERATRTDERGTAAGGRAMGLDDALYAELMAAHEGLGDEAARALDARLILLLMNEVGDADRNRRVLAAAVGPSGGPEPERAA